MSLRVLLIDPMTPYNDQINLGLVSLASYIDRIGHDVRIVDMNFRKEDAHKRLDEALTQLNPEVVGISIMTYFAFSEVRSLLRKLRTQTKSRIVVGGSSPSMFPERMLSENDEIDFLIVQEGEETFADLLTALSQRAGGFADIRGLVFRDGARVIVNDKRPLIRDLDSLPMLNFNLVDLVTKYGFQYYKDTYIMATSRGCPYNCSFCLSNVLCNRRWRPFSAQRVVDEIKNAYEKYRLRRISFQDDNFVMKPQRVIEICRLIREQGLNINLHLDGGIRADRLTEDSLRELCASGLKGGTVAVESGSKKVFDMIGKGETLDEVEKAVTMLKSANFDLQAYMILGLPGDTHQTFLESMKFVKKHNLKCRWHLAFPFEGTRMYEYVKSNGQFLRNCSGYDIDVISDNHVTVPGTFPLAFDTPEYPARQRLADYYYAVIESENIFYIYGGKYKSHVLHVMRLLFQVLRYAPHKLPTYFLKGLHKFWREFKFKINRERLRDKNSE